MRVRKIVWKGWNSFDMRFERATAYSCLVSDGASVNADGRIISAKTWDISYPKEAA